MNTSNAWCCLPLLVGLCGLAASTDPAPVLRIESVVPAPVQPHTANQHVVWYDSFDEDRIVSYLEPKAGSPQAHRSTTEALGAKGQSMECFYAKGSQGVGNRKLVFGDSPIGKPLRKGEKFEDIYWRIYVKHQLGWVGSPAKLSRATGMVSSTWQQAFISHVWSSGVGLTLDPVSGVQGDQVVTTRYNDFAHFKWLGNKPNGTLPLHATEESGRWVCVESRIKLNSPGKKDGYAALWIDGRLDAERTSLDFRGSYTGPGSTVNAVFLEAYWNEGSPRDQYRWYDDFVVSTEPIGPLTATANPTLIRTVGAPMAGWEARVAEDPDGTKLVWGSGLISGLTNRVSVTAQNGAFEGRQSRRDALTAGPMYFCQVRQKNQDGTWSEWSRWHQPFFVTAGP